MKAIPGIPLIRVRQSGASRSGLPPSPYVRRLRLAEVGHQEGVCHPCPFGVFAWAGFPLAECMILSEEAHREFMGQSGLKEDLLAPPRGGEDADSRATRIGLSHRSSPLEGELNRQICDALIGLGARSITVVSEGPTGRALESIPEVKDAIREAWLYPEGLRRQVEAASLGEEIPSWPIFILVEGRAL